ncbi:MAG: oxygen-independent coproporphyrinogen III oxidase [Hyphomicrobiaceae bacterium]
MPESAELVERYARPAPRYTSYPTANHFSPAIGRSEYRAWLAEVPRDPNLSLYLHIPFCEILCHYCACTTKATRRYEPVKRYVGALKTEIAHVAGLLLGRPSAAHVHWGGGSPSVLAPAEILAITEVLRSSFAIPGTAEMAVEVDPRNTTPEKVAAFAEAGINRVSLGVQDFDDRVQEAIGRIQSFDLTRRTLDLFRERGVASINIDLVYGLPHQTVESVARTIELVVQLAPDRIATFGYAHLPQRVKPQRLIDGAALPGPQERYAQASLIVCMLEEAGYRRIGLDHFARSGDSLASKPLRRNFQGYTSDPADALIGFGASAIGKLPGGYAQNAVPTHHYERLVAEHGIATARGIALSADDKVRAYLIERLMCDFRVSPEDLVSQFGEAARPILDDVASVLDRDEDGFLAFTGDAVEVTDRGRPFVRSICARFDSYLTHGAGTHSTAV